MLCLKSNGPDNKRAFVLSSWHDGGNRRARLNAAERSGRGRPFPQTAPGSGQLRISNRLDSGRVENFLSVISPYPGMTTGRK
ncbi:hypothetical protein RRG08_024823 [Elysia crispata]|uniref:Uncharacterized protein n=1 Tax=Elysia crispata TaxID=231223 RepID=A0AAE0YK50_9GAST|nr:hypothetical protein RRG08_024823 [Elysia crispata]